MDRLMVGAAVGVGVVLAAPLAAIIGLTAWEEGKCKDGLRELRSVRGAVAADLAPLHSDPLETVSVCDSGDPPYLSTRLGASVSPQKATRHLEGRGWRIVETDRRPNGQIRLWGLQKKYRTASAYLSIKKAEAAGTASLNVHLL
ncbi:hypothetical protein AB0C21_06260 [Spirillospora sp. NPDC049024]